MSGPFKMKGWSPFTQKTGKGLIMPKDHPVKPPTEEQMKKSKGELFERAWPQLTPKQKEKKLADRKKYLSVIEQAKKNRERP